MKAPRRLALLIFELTTITAPRSQRDEALAERRSHLFESAQTGTPAARDLARTLRGVIDDVRFGLDLRAQAGRPSLPRAAFTEQAVSLVIGGVFIAVFAPLLLVHGHTAAVARAVAFIPAAIVLLGGPVVRAVLVRRSGRRTRPGT